MAQFIISTGGAVDLIANAAAAITRTTSTN